jgi:hypothetical protein
MGRATDHIATILSFSSGSAFESTSTDEFTANDQTDVAICLDSELLPKIVQRLDDEDVDVREAAIEVIIFLSEHGEIPL